MDQFEGQNDLAKDKPSGKLKWIVLSVVGALVGAVVGAAVLQSLFGAPSLDEYAAGKEGVPFSDPAGSFSVIFPGEPERTEQTTPLEGGTEVKTTLYMVDEGDYVFSLGVTEIPSDTGFSLEAAVQGAVDAVKGKLVSSSPRKLGQFEGMFFEIEAEDTTISQWGIVAGSRFYQVQVVGVPYGDKSVARFFESLSVK